MRAWVWPRSTRPSQVRPPVGPLSTLSSASSSLSKKCSVNAGTACRYLIDGTARRPGWRRSAAARAAPPGRWPDRTRARGRGRRRRPAGRMPTASHRRTAPARAPPAPPPAGAPRPGSSRAAGRDLAPGAARLAGAASASAPAMAMIIAATIAAIRAPQRHPQAPKTHADTSRCRACGRPAPADQLPRRYPDKAFRGGSRSSPGGCLSPGPAL